MEFAQFHSFEPHTTESVSAGLRALLRPEWLHRRAEVGVAVRGPWRPADIWTNGLERLAWTVAIESHGGPLLSERGEAELGGAVNARRRAPPHPIESLAQRAGEGLVVVYSDAACFAYVAVYRQRHLAWSLMLQDRVVLVRCDGQVVQVAEPPRWIPEGDRTGVLLAGLQQWLREPLGVHDSERYFLPDTLGQLTGDVEPHWVVRGGVFPVIPGDPGRARASG